MGGGDMGGGDTSAGEVGRTASGRRPRTPRLTAAAALALLLFNYPFLALFDLDVRVLGIPLLWAYLFVVWALVVALVAWLVRDA
jgi:hypothetical protein